MTIAIGHGGDRLARAYPSPPTQDDPEGNDQMTMRKLMMLLATVLALGLVAAGCGDDEEKQATEDAIEAAEEATDVTPEELEQLQDQAEEAQEQLKTLTDEIPQSLEEARELCLKNVEQLPDSEGKEIAKAACEAGGE